MENIGENIRAIRRLQDRKQEQIAGDLGVSQKTYSNYETGKTIPTLPMCERIAEIFKVPLNDLLFKNNSAPPR